MEDYLDYLEDTKAKPNEPRRIKYENYIKVKTPKAEPPKFCDCGQKLSIGNKGDSCYQCTEKKKKNK